MSANSPKTASARSKASANTAFPRAMPRASRCSSMSRPGSSATIRTSSAPPSSTASRWASISRPSSCATRASTASRCARSTSISANGTARWSRSGRTERHRRAPRLPAGSGLERRRIEQARRGARQRLCQHRAARGDRRAFRASRSSGSPRRMPSARSGSTGAPRCGPRGGSTPSASAGRSGHGQAVERRGPSAPAACPAHERRAFPGACGRAAADAARASMWWRTMWRPACR